MRRARGITTVAVLALLGFGRGASAQFYEQRNLVSDGSVPADHANDSQLKNAWGLTASATSPWWIADNGTNLSTLYNGNTGEKQGLVVQVGGAPTGAVFNGTGGFLLNGSPARFIFSAEDGRIRAWNGGAAATVTQTVDGAIYKGLAIASTPAGPRLYATNFHAATVDVFDTGFNLVPGGFVDPNLPAGYAPFGIQTINDTVYVTYALQDEDKEDEIAGQGNGFVDAYDLSGNFVRRVASGGVLNAPWGVALAPDDFGKYSNDLLIGNFGDGKIHAFSPDKLEGNGQYQLHGPLHSVDGAPLVIDGLWAIQFGNGAAAGPRTTLFFTAGPDDEEGGLFGSLVVGHP
ncbi:MAG: TIGR03118 family protein, partial [Acidobacteriota bacterium]